MFVVRQIESRRKQREIELEKIKSNTGSRRTWVWMLKGLEEDMGLDANRIWQRRRRGVDGLGRREDGGCGGRGGGDGSGS